MWLIAHLLFAEFELNFFEKTKAPNFFGAFFVSKIDSIMWFLFDRGDYNIVYYNSNEVNNYLKRRNWSRLFSRFVVVEVSF